MSDENDEVVDGGDSNADSITISPELEAKFDEVFGDLSDADVAKLENEDTESQPQSVEQTNRSKHRQALARKEQADELVEEGIVSGDDPDGEGTEVEATDDESQEKSEGQKPAAKTAAPSVLDKIDPTLKFAANELGMSDDDIAKLMKADPEVGAQTLAKLADTYTNLSRQFLTLPGSPLAQGIRQDQEAPAKTDAPLSKLDTFYSQIEEFAEENGEALASFAKSLKAEVIDPVKGLLAEVAAHKQELANTEARQTMTDLSGKFGEFYGADGSALTDVHLNNRKYLGQVADQIRAGAKAQGRELPIKDALYRAHLLVTADYRDKLVRKQISAQVQTRAKQITAKPTQRTNPQTSSGRSRAAALEAASRKMADIGLLDYVD